MVTMAEAPGTLPSVWVIARAGEQGYADWIVSVLPPGRGRQIIDTAALSLQYTTSRHGTQVSVSGQPTAVEPLVALYQHKADREAVSARGGNEKAAARAQKSLQMVDALNLIAQAGAADRGPDGMLESAKLLAGAQKILFDSGHVHPQKGIYVQEQNAR
jgi:hypothetical protein